MVALLAGAEVPTDRPIDGVDPLDFFLGRQTHSNCEDFVYCMEEEMRAAKRRDWKLHFIWEPEINDGGTKLEAPCLFNQIQNPKEETKVMMEFTWVRSATMRMVHEFRQSPKKSPPALPGTPDPYAPPAAK